MKQSFSFGELYDNVWCIQCRYIGKVNTDGT